MGEEEEKQGSTNWLVWKVPERRENKQKGRQYCEISKNWHFYVLSGQSTFGNFIQKTVKKSLTCRLHGDILGGPPALGIPRLAPTRELAKELLDVVPGHLQRQGLDGHPRLHPVPLAVLGTGGHGLAVAGEVGLVRVGHGAPQLGRLAPDDVAVGRVGGEHGQHVREDLDRGSFSRRSAEAFEQLCGVLLVVGIQIVGQK